MFVRDHNGRNCRHSSVPARPVVTWFRAPWTLIRRLVGAARGETIGQAGNSVADARLYETLEEQVEERTNKLKIALVELERLASTDKLTGIYNRRKLDEVAKHEVERAKRNRQSLSLLILDIDFFKKVNDTWGHPVGDEILSEVSRVVQASIRSTDILARWGGEEFVILAPETSLPDARAIGERIRAAIKAHRFPTVEHLTASLGVAEYKPGDTLGSLIKRADDALYQAKRAGRDGVRG